MKAQKDRLLMAAWYAAAFGFLYIWFSRVHPLMVYDVDDWTYLAYIRSALPLWGDWNPAKVFPEVVMPTISSIAHYALMPLIGDYLRTFTVVHALTVSGAVTIYLWCFSGMLRRLWKLSGLSNVLLSMLFFLFHFLVFRGKGYANLYMFHCVDLNCYYNYLIPALMGASMVMYMLGNEQFEAFVREGSPEKKGLALLILYFTVFSNLTTSGIPAAFAGSVLLLRLLQGRKQFRLKAYCRDNAAYLLILAAWFVSAVFELSGGRAASAEQVSLVSRLITSVYLLKEVIFTANPAFWATVIGIVGLTVFFFLRARGKGEAEKQYLPGTVMVLVAAAAMLVYLLLLCAVVDPEYMLRAEYLFGIFFYGFVLVMLAAAYLVRKKPGLLMILPLLLAVLLSQVNTDGRTFQESNKYNIQPQICDAVSRDILDQIMTAAEAGQITMTLYVPYNVADPYTTDNWPHTLELMPRIPGALYEHGLLLNKIAITQVQPTLDMNVKHGLPIPEGLE